MGRQQFFLEATKAGVSKSRPIAIFDAAAQRYAGIVSLYTQFNRDAIGIWPAARRVDRRISIEPIGAGGAARSVARHAVRIAGLSARPTSAPRSSARPPISAICSTGCASTRCRGRRDALAVLDCAAARHPAPQAELPEHARRRCPYIDLVNEILADAISPPSRSEFDDQSALEADDGGQDAAQTCARRRSISTRTRSASCSARAIRIRCRTARVWTSCAPICSSRASPLWQLRAGAVAAARADRSRRSGRSRGRAVRDDAARPSIVATPDLRHGQRRRGTCRRRRIRLRCSCRCRRSCRPPRSPTTTLLELLQVVLGARRTSTSRSRAWTTPATRAFSRCPQRRSTPGCSTARTASCGCGGAAGYKMWELDLLLGAPAVAQRRARRAGARGAAASSDSCRTRPGCRSTSSSPSSRSIDVQSHRDPDGSADHLALRARRILNPAVTPRTPMPISRRWPQARPRSDDQPRATICRPSRRRSGSPAHDAQRPCSRVFGLDAAEHADARRTCRCCYRVTMLAPGREAGDQTELVDRRAAARARRRSATAALTAIFATPAATQTFLQQSKAIQQSGFTIDALAYLLTPPPWTTTTGMTDAGISAVLDAVRDADPQPQRGRRERQRHRRRGCAARARQRCHGLPHAATCRAVVQLSVAGRTLSRC